MKALKIIFIVLIVLLIIITGGLYFYIKSFDVNRFKPQIEAEITKQLNRDTHIANMSLNLSWSDGITLVVDKISVDEKTDVYQNKVFLNIDKIRMNVDVAAFVSARKIVVTEVLVESPAVYVTKNKEGKINWQDLASAQSQPSSESTSVPKVSEEGDSAQAVVLPDFTVKDIKVQNGQVFYEDAGFNPALKLAVEAMSVSIRDFGINKDVDFRASAKLLSTKENIDVTGQVFVEIPKQAVMLKNVSFSTNLADINTDALNSLLKSFEADYLKSSLVGSLKGQINQLSADATGLKAMKANLSILDAKVALKFLEFPLDNIDVEILADEKDLTIQQFYFYLASGRVDIKGKVGNYMSAPSLTLSGQLEDVKVQELLPAEFASLDVQGLIDGRFDFNAKDAVNLLPTAKADGGFTLQDGVINDFNLLKTVLEKISVVPNLSEKIIANLPTKYKETLIKRNTVIKALSVNFKLENEQAPFDTHLEAEGFIFDMNGQVDMALNSMVNASLKIFKDLSASMVSSVPALGGLYNEKQEIVVPLMPYRGSIDKYKPIPDVEQISKNLIKEQGKEELKKVIFKALDIEEAAPQSESATPEVQDPDSQQQPQQQKRPEEEIINNVLDLIFK